MARYPSRVMKSPMMNNPQYRLKMKKVLTITWNTDTGSMFTDWGDGVTATDVLAMCEFAEGEAEFEIEEQNNESDE